MPRTFSLARLLLAVALFCLICGLAVNFPVFGIFCAPAVVVLVCFVCFSNEPIAMALICFVGACAGGMFLPWLVFAVLGEPSVPRLQENQLVGSVVTGVCPAIGALLAGGAVVLLELCYPPPTTASTKTAPDECLLRR